MTLQQHYAAAREIWTICEANRRLWLLTGDVFGAIKPYGRAMVEIRKVRDKLAKRFAHDFPGVFDPYADIEC